jgi:hypothetical protein
MLLEGGVDGVCADVEAMHDPATGRFHLVGE